LLFFISDILQFLSWNEKLITLDSSQDVISCLKKLTENRITSAPVKFKNNYWLVDLGDISYALITFENIPQCSLGVLCELSGKSPSAKLDVGSTLSEAVHALVIHRTHRLLITKSDVPYAIFSHMDLIRWLVAHPDSIPRCLRGKKVKQIRSLDVFTVKDQETLVDAITMCVSNQVTGLGVVNQNGTILTGFGISDLKLIPVDLYPDIMSITIEQFLRTYRPNFREQQFYSFPDSTFEEIIVQMKQEHVHRIFICSPDLIPQGVFSASDVGPYLAAERKTQAFKDYPKATWKISNEEPKTH